MNQDLGGFKNKTAPRGAFCPENDSGERRLTTWEAKSF